jgi:hypothetical protein
MSNCVEDPENDGHDFGEHANFAMSSGPFLPRSANQRKFALFRPSLVF